MTNCISKVQASHCCPWTTRRKSRKRKRSQSRSHTRTLSSISFSLLRVCILQCFWPGGRHQLEKVEGWWMLVGRPSGFALLPAGPLQLSTFGLWLLLSCSQRGNSKPTLIIGKPTSAYEPYKLQQMMKSLLVCVPWPGLLDFPLTPCCIKRWLFTTYEYGFACQL